MISIPFILKKYVNQNIDYLNPIIDKSILEFISDIKGYKDDLTILINPYYFCYNSDSKDKEKYKICISYKVLKNDTDLVENFKEWNKYNFLKDND